MRYSRCEVEIFSNCTTLVNSNDSKLYKLLIFIIAVVFLVAVPLQCKAIANGEHSVSRTADKERLVLMPLRVPEEDKNLTGAMEVALAEGLQLKYDVFSGEQVSQKARQIFLKESRNTTHAECDETRCMQNIAEAFQAELIATANVTKQDGTYFLALSIQNIFDNKVVYSKSLPCEGCNEAQVINKLKELSGAIVTSSPVGEDAQHKANKNDSDASIAKLKAIKGEETNGPVMVHIPGKSYEISKYDVTQAEWRAVMGTNPSKFKSCGDNCPVEQVRWNDVQIFLQRLNAKTSGQYRLPTEEEWEYACYGGRKTEYCGGDDINSVAWYGENSSKTTHPVGKKQANGYGLYDMSGNVYQWMQNNYQNNFHALRGGAWNEYARYLRAANRYGYDGANSIPAAHRFYIGFRLARTIVSAP